MSPERIARTWRSLGVTLVAGACLVAHPAHAQSDADKENAQALYKAGNDARDAGDVKGAAAKYKVAYALVPTPVIALALGKAQMETGQLIEARQTLLGVDRIPPKPHESALTMNARAEAASLAAQLELRIPTVTLKLGLSNNNGPAPSVTIDGTPIVEVALAVPRRVNPGPHVVVATVDGAKTDVPFTLREAEARDLVVPYPTVAPVAVVPLPVPVVVAPPAPTAPAPPPAQEAPAAKGGSRAPAYVAFGVGGAGIVVTAVFGVLALGNKSTLDSACGSDKSSCGNAQQSNINGLHTDAIVSDVGLGVAIAGVGLGTVLLLVGPSKKTTAGALLERVQPYAGPSALGLQGTF